MFAPVHKVTVTIQVCVIAQRGRCGVSPVSDSVQFTVYYVQCTMYSSQCTVQYEQLTMCSVYCAARVSPVSDRYSWQGGNTGREQDTAPHAAHCTLQTAHTAHCSLNSATRTLHTTYWTLYNKYLTLHSLHGWLHCTLLIPNSRSWGTLHSALCTLYTLDQFRVLFRASNNVLDCQARLSIYHIMNCVVGIMFASL